MFSENEIKIDSLFREKISSLNDINEFMSERIEQHLSNYNSVSEEDYTDVVKYIDNFFDYPVGLGGNFGGFYYSILQYLKNSSYIKKNTTINKKMLVFERQLKLNEIIKKSLVTYQSALESTTDTGSIWIINMEVSKTLSFLKKLSDFSEFESDEYLIINYFILKNIIQIDKQSSITWDFGDVLKRYNKLTDLAESKDNYLFKINIQQTFDEFVNNIDYSLYNKLYTDDQLVQIEDIVSSY